MEIPNLLSRSLERPWRAVLARQHQGQQPPRGREPPGPTCNGSELAAEFRQMWLPAKNGQQVDPKDPTPTSAATCCPRGANPGTQSSAPSPAYRRPQVQPPGDVSCGNLLLQGHVWVTPKGPARTGTAGPHPTCRRRSPQGWIDPHVPRKGRG